MRVTRLALMLFTFVFLAQWQPGKSSSSDSNSTASGASSLLDDEDDDEVDEALENMDFAEFKERYRRLIQYRTYYVASNYLNSQVLGAVNQQHPQQQQQQQQHGYDGETAQPTNPLIRKPQRLVPLGRPIEPVVVVSPRRKPIGRPSNGVRHKQDEKFVPSVQYDPKDIGGDTDYFTPLKYAAAKLNYDQADYVASPYDRIQQQQQSRVFARPEQQQQPQQQHQPSSSYYAKTRAPARPADNLHLRKYIPARPKAPSSSSATAPHATQHQDYLLDYGTRASGNKAPFHSSDYAYQAEDYEPVRINVEPPPRIYQKPTRILAQSRPLSPLQLVPNPAVNLHDIMKSLQLTNRLPEMLNRDNIDSSIRTLVEILSILNNAKHADYPRITESGAIALPPPPPPPPQSPRKPATSYKPSYKPNYGRPKVVTETRFQATPTPPIAHDENRYESYEPNYIGNKQQNIEYYTPLVQDIDEPSAERYRPTSEPEKMEENTEHRYAITEDLADDLLEQEKYSEPPPATTETPVSKFQLPDGVSTHQLVPPTTLKYGATRGKPNVDYPAYAAIPETEFNCKEQRYKGFFGDPSTGCQVWHYCDLNGGKSSFLCPNGTIFSQVALTCDWWFNVRCESTTQLYVLNERLYKYILPIMPKFPEDFSGPEVDRYLELKFKEMEAKLREKKLKKQQEKDKVKEKLQALETDD